VPSLGRPDPQHTINCRDAKTWTAGTIYDGELVSDRDDFQVQRGARLDDKSERVEQRDNDGRHIAGYRRTLAASIDATPTKFSVDTAGSVGGPLMREVSVGQTSGAAQRCSTPASLRELAIRDPHRR
jgi:hypothetical protein